MRFWVMAWAMCSGASAVILLWIELTMPPEETLTVRKLAVCVFASVILGPLYVFVFGLMGVIALCQRLGEAEFWDAVVLKRRY